MGHAAASRSTLSGSSGGPSARTRAHGAALLLLFTLAASIHPLAGVAFAHDTPPLRVIRTTAGAYPIVVGLYGDPPRVGQILALTVTFPDATPGITATLSGSPGPGTDAVRVSGSLTPDGNEVGVLVGAVRLTVRGAWNLEIAVRGPAGSGTARVPVVAVEEGAIAEPIAWAIGLSPLAGLIAFAFWQRRRLRALPRSERIEDAPA